MRAIGTTAYIVLGNRAYKVTIISAKQSLLFEDKYLVRSDNDFVYTVSADDLWDCEEVQ